jgi:hemerythrin-like domain-containing protein
MCRQQRIQQLMLQHQKLLGRLSLIFLTSAYLPNITIMESAMHALIQQLETLIHKVHHAFHATAWLITPIHMHLLWLINSVQVP